MVAWYIVLGDARIQCKDGLKSLAVGFVSARKCLRTRQTRQQRNILSVRHREATPVHHITQKYHSIGFQVGGFSPTFADVKVYEDLGNVGENSRSIRVGAVVEYLGICYH